ncbi:MAG: precorrin-3B synthase [Pseudorhizobium sp.]
MTALSLDTSTLDRRRGACPALSAPMQTGDGLLARIALTEALRPSQLVALCRLARRHGNGILDISARGNLQVRGLTEYSAPRLDADVRALQLPLRDGLAAEVPPLAGMDPDETADPRLLAAAIRKGAAEIQGLAPKMSVVVDGGGRLRLSGLLADVRLVAEPHHDGIGWKLLLGGTEDAGGVHGVFSEAEAAAATLALLRELASRGSKARGRDLAAGLPRHAAAIQSISLFGLHPLAEGHAAAGIGPAFGQIDAERLAALCEEAVALGMTAVKPALDHSLIFFGAPDACDRLLAFADINRFVTSGNDPRSSIAACPGRPACASGEIETHALGALAARECADLLDGSFKLHVSGCAKGCAHPQPSPLTLCGTPAGLAWIAGRAADPALAVIDPHNIATALGRVSALVRSERRDGEHSAACLSRLGPDRIAAYLMSGQP